MMKKFVSLAVAVVLLVSALCVQTFAADSMAITSADINAVINKDGTVSVTETWNVEPTNEDKGFCRQIDIYDEGGLNEMKLTEKYDEIRDVSVKIDGIDAEESPSGVNTFSFKKSADARRYDINILSPYLNENKTYTIEYTIVGAMKKSGGKAVFAFQFIGKTFLLTANNVTVNVTVPADSASGSLEIPEDSKGIVTGDKTAEFTLKRVYDTMNVELRCDDNVFDENALVSYSAFSAKLKSFSKSIKNVAPFIVFIIAAVVAAVLILNQNKLKRRKLEKEAVQLPDGSNTLPEGKTPCEAYKMLVPYSRVSPKATTKKVPLLFALSVLECIDKGYLAVNDSELIVGSPVGEAPAYIISTLNFLKSFCEKKNEKYVINKAFEERVAAECSMHYDVIANYLSTFYNLIPSVDGKFFKDEKNCELYENAYAVKVNAEKLKSKLTFDDCAGSILAGEKSGDAQIFAIMFSSLSGDKLFAKASDSAAGCLAGAIGAMYKVYVKSK